MCIVEVLTSLKAWRRLPILESHKGASSIPARLRRQARVARSSYEAYSRSHPLLRSMRKRRENLEWTGFNHGNFIQPPGGQRAPKLRSANEDTQSAFLCPLMARILRYFSAKSNFCFHSMSTTLGFCLEVERIEAGMHLQKRVNLHSCKSSSWRGQTHHYGPASGDALNASRSIKMSTGRSRGYVP